MATSFYRNQNSLFPSGQASRLDLETHQIRAEMDIHYDVTWDKKEFTLPGAEILRDVDVLHWAESKANVQLLSNNESNAPILKVLKAGEKLSIIQTDSYWAQVYDAGVKKIGWVPLHQLVSHNEDKGVFINFIDTYIRQAPRDSAPLLTTLPRLQRILPLAIVKNFLKIEYNHQIGYVDINHFISRADFANLAYDPHKKTWVVISHRENENLVSVTGQKLAIAEATGYVTTSQRGIVVNPLLDDGPRLRSQVTIVKPEAFIWGVSNLDGHGQVWWHKTNLLLPVESGTSITTEELMKKEIYSISFESKDSLRGLVSAGGVYRTDDGKNWTFLPQFGKQNYPVNIHPKGPWFVGSFRSVDQGHNFEPFIRWERIAEAIEANTHHNPRILKLTQIQSLPSQIQIFVDTGTQKVKLRSSLDNFNWYVIRN